MEKRYQVFISSTYADLKNEREKVIQILMALDCIPAGMELFPATDEDQFEFIKRILNDCDYYLLIIGGRYGSVTEKGISYTEQEYDYALSVGLKVIALLHENPSQISVENSEQNPELRTRLEDFRNKVANNRLVKFWKNADELAGIVASSLPSTIKLFPAVGWVRANKVSNEELLSEINELRKENAALRKQLSEIEPNIFTASEEKDFLYIYRKLNRFQDIKIFLKSKESNGEEVKIFSINIGSLVPFLSASNYHEYGSALVSDLILKQVYNFYDKENHRLTVAGTEKLADELKVYGLLAKIYVPPSSQGGLSRVIQMNGMYKMVFSEKMERYRYWLDVNGKIPMHIEINEKVM